MYLTVALGRAAGMSHLMGKRGETRTRNRDNTAAISRATRNGDPHLNEQAHERGDFAKPCLSSFLSQPLTPSEHRNM